MNKPTAKSIRESAAKAGKEDTLSQLRHLILQGDEERLAELQCELKALRNKIDTTEEWFAKMDEILVEAVALQSQTNPVEMAEALAPVMGPAITLQIKDSQAEVIDALYPVIGKTIRKSIARLSKT